MNGLAICMFARYGSGGDPPEPLGMFARDYVTDIFAENIFNSTGNLEEGDGLAFIESTWNAFFHRTFFFYFVAVGYFLVIAMQTMGTMFGDRNQLEVRGMEEFSENDTIKERLSDPLMVAVSSQPVDNGCTEFS